MFSEILIPPLSEGPGAGQDNVALKGHYTLAAWLVGATLLAALCVMGALWAFSQIDKTAEARKQLRIVINNADNFLSELKDAETGQRGYLLTGDDVYLEPYLRVRNDLVNHLSELRQLVLSDTAQKHLDAIIPLIDARMDELAKAIAFRRNHDLTSAISSLDNGQGKHLMDSIRTEIAEFIQIEEIALEQQEAQFRASMRHMFVGIVIASIFALILAVLIAYLVYRRTQQRHKNLHNLETQRLLTMQEQINNRLQQVNVALKLSEQKLAVTLSSIGDGLIVTDSDARVTIMNPVAEALTGWTLTEAMGRPINDIFHIIKQENRQPATIPVMATLAKGTIQGLANHTILITRDGVEFAIADSCAPIRCYDDEIKGAVLIFRDVTQDYAIQTALRDSEATQMKFSQRLQLALDGGHMGDWNWDAESNRVTLGARAAEMFGFPAELPVTREQMRERLNPEDAGAANKDWDRALAEHTDYVNEYRVHRPKEGHCWIAITGRGSYASDGTLLGMNGVMQDISQRKQIEEVLRESEIHFRKMIDALPTAIYTTDAEGRLTYFNPAAVEFAGQVPELGADQWCVNWKLFRPDGTPMPHNECPMAITLKENQAIRGTEAIAERPDGTRVLFMPYPTPLSDAHGKLIGGINMLVDITERRRSELELIKAMAAAEKANLAKSEFLSSMSHELRTPLNAILGFAQLLETGTPTPTNNQIIKLQQITKAGWYLLELINEILDLALIESGKLSMSQEPVSLAAIILECQSLIEVQAQQRAIKLIFHPFDEPWFVYADRTRVKQILINLLSNAIKYNRPQGFVEVKCTLASPELIRIAVNDNGDGLPSEKLAKLFQPFNRLGQENGTEEGTGIGLVVTKKLVELMGGTVGVESTVGVGSTFWVELIRDHTPQPASKSAMPLELDRPRINPEQHTLLYVEDNPANLMLVEQIMSEHSHLIMLSAVNADQGIALARTHLPNIILMDINLPGISGIQALKTLRDDPLTQHIPIIALSANAMPRDIEKGLKAGFFRYLTKPIKVNEFMVAIDESLKLSTIKLVAPVKTDTYDVER